MAKHTATAQQCPTLLITHVTELSLPEVQRRLDLRLGHLEPVALARLFEAKSEGEFRKTVAAATQGRDFFVFKQASYHNWLRLFPSTRSISRTVLYTIGNPLIAQGIFECDGPTVAAVVPFRLVLKEGSVEGTTEIVYHRPSSLLPQSSQAFQQLDVKIESLIQSFVADTGGVCRSKL